MIKNIYDITLKLITPSDLGSHLDFISKQDEILEAVYHFNEKFRTWSKRIVVYLISRKSIHLLLFMESEKHQEHITAREVRFFTTFLNNQKNWNVYSRHSSKLFEGVNFAECSFEAARSQIDRMDKDSELYNSQLEEIEYLDTENLRRSVVSGSEATLEDALDISDEDIVPIVSYLLKTKNKGNNRIDKAETISQLKEILKKWL